MFWSMKRLRVHNSDTTDGKLFCAFIALILSSYIQNQLGVFMRSNGMTVRKLLLELDKIKGFALGNLIRRLTPLQCERLQGFPDGWTDIPDASDTARYKALGNSVAIPCVDFVMRGIAAAIRSERRRRRDRINLMQLAA